MLKLRNIKLIKTLSLILFIFLIPLIFAQQSEKIILFHFTIYKNESVILNKLDIVEGTVNIVPSNKGEYIIRILSEGKEILLETGIDVEFEFHREIVQPDGSIRDETVTYNETEKLYRLPYLENSSLIQLFHGDKKIWEYNVEYLSSRVPPPAPLIIEPTPSPSQPSSSDLILLILGGFCLAVLVIVIVVYVIFIRKKKWAK